MAGRRISARRLSMSRAARKHLKAKKRQKKLGAPEKTPEISRKAVWILVIAALITLGFVVAQMVAQGGFGRG